MKEFFGVFGKTVIFVYAFNKTFYMLIVKLGGTDKQLYELVAPLVMNPAIIRQNNNYPYKTSRNHIWYLASEQGLVLDFIPVKTGDNGALIDNYWFRGDDMQVADALLESVTGDFGDAGLLSALVHKRHVETFGTHGFVTTKIWSKYDKMQYRKQPAQE